MIIRNQPGLRRGFTLIEIMVVVAIIALLAAVAVPNFVKSREQARKQTCINNLKTIDSAKHMWGMEAKKNPSAVPAESDLFGDTLYIKRLPACPSGGTYTLRSVGEFPTCTITGHTL